jgi:hypothetical protein
MTRVRELTLKLLDGPPHGADAAELDRLLADPAAAAEHVALLELEAALRGLRTGFDLAAGTLADIRTAQADRTAAAVFGRIAAAPAPAWTRRHRKPHRFGAWVALVAAALVVGLWLGGRGGTPVVRHPDPPTLATLRHVTGEVELVAADGAVSKAEPGAAVGAGVAVRTVGDDSGAVVELADRTRVGIEPDTTVRFPLLGPQVVLAHGRLRAEVPGRAGGEPMVVRTPGGDIVTRGASFLVASAGEDSVRVEPWLGSVELVRPDAARSVAVAAGGAAVALAGPVQVETAAALLTSPRRTLSVDAFPGTHHAVFAPDGRDLWAAAGKRVVRWTPDGGTAVTEFHPRAGADGVLARFSPDLSAVVTLRGERDDGLVVRDAPDWPGRVTIRATATEPRFLAVGPAADWVATAAPRPNGRVVAVWDGRTGAPRFSRPVENEVNCLASTPDGRAVAVGVSDLGRGVNNKVVFFDAATGDRRFSLPTQRRALTALAFTSDGRFLAVGFNGQVQLWDVPARELVRVFGGFERVPTCLAFSAGGRRLAAGMQDGQVWVWNAESAAVEARLQTATRGVRSVMFAPDGRSVVVAANRAPVTVWDLPAEPGDPGL